MTTPAGPSPAVMARTHGLAIGIGLIAIVAVAIIMALIAFGLLLFLGVSVILAAIFAIGALIGIFRKDWLIVGVMIAAIISLLWLRPFDLTLADVAFAMGVDH